MSVEDQKRFTDAMTKAVAETRGDLGKRFTDNWRAAVIALNGLAMADMLPAMNKITRADAEDIVNFRDSYAKDIGPDGFKRFEFAKIVVFNREIADCKVPDDQVNEGREFLGCTRMDNAGVRRIIDASLQQAKEKLQGDSANPALRTYVGDSCCGAFKYAWLRILVPKRREPGASLIADLAAAAHYMLARYHVCSAKASVTQMRSVVNLYDGRKRDAIRGGDRSLKSMALNAGSQPFPPDFAVMAWAIRGATEGNADRLRCNPDASLPLVVPTVNDSEA